MKKFSGSSEDWNSYEVKSFFLFILKRKREREEMGWIESH